MTKIKKICEQCGKVFFVIPSRIDTARFCSRVCYVEWLLLNSEGENNHSWKGGLVKRTCEICGSVFFAKPSSIEKGHDRFCSSECWYKWRSINLRKEKVYNWKGGLAERICQTCGKTFYVKPSKIKIGAGKYCSLSCARKGKKISRHHTRPETIFEGLCKKHHLSFYFVGDGQLWIGKKGKKQLNPDFIEANGKKICVEIMGVYWHSRLLNQKLRGDALLPYRKKHYRRFKWQPIFIWDTDLLREDAEQFVLNELQKAGAIK